MNDVAARTGALWLSFLTLNAYLIISTGSVTHRNLLLEMPLKLPLLGAELSLQGYFVVAPIFLVLFHFYLLLQLNALVDRIRSYNAVLNASVKSRDERRILRQRLDTFILVQLLAGPYERREPLIHLLLKVLLWVTILVIPLSSLLQLQLTFLAFHSESITWIHRTLLVLDLGTIWLWVMIAGDRRTMVSLCRKPVGIALTFSTLIFSLAVGIFPGETIYDFAHSPITALVLESDQAASLKSPFANRLIVTDQTTVSNRTQLPLIFACEPPISKIRRLCLIQ